MEYNQELLQEMMNEVNLLDYACQTIEFKRVNNDSYSAHCPLHTDKTASLFITPSKNMYWCFSCNRGGKIINWMMDFEKLSFRESVNKLVSITGKEIQSIQQCETVGIYKNISSLYNKEETHSICRPIIPYSEYAKYSDEFPEEWIEEGISKEQMRRFDIRIDKSANRIVYPVYDSNFNLIGVKGRTRFQDFKLLKISKYMNYYKLITTDFFIGMKENIESIKNHNEIIIVEGIKSVMKLSDYGYDWCVAAETSTLNDEQIKLLLKLHIKNIVIAFDNDVDTNKILKNLTMLKRFSNVYLLSDSKCVAKRLLPEDKMSPCDAGKDIFDRLYAERKKI